MRYVLLAYCDRRWLAGLSDDERAALRREWAARDAALREGGQIQAAQHLGDGEFVVTVRALDGAMAVDVGPLQAAGLGPVAVFLIETRDLNDAIRLTAGLPEAREGPIEIWPAQGMSGGR